jgi:RimJ/RimL family protein N-acetyltransferase
VQPDASTDVRLATVRLELFRTDIHFTPQYLSWLQTEKIASRNMEFCTHFDVDQESAKQWVISATSDPDSFFFAVVTGDHEHVGNIRLYFDQASEPAWYIGVLIGQGSRGRGIAPAAIAVLANAAVDSMMTKEVVARIYEDNPQSRSAFMRAGFRERASGVWNDHGCVRRYSTLVFP